MPGAEIFAPLGIRRDLVRYLCVGILNTLVGLSTIYGCIYLLGLDDVQANLIGYGIGIVCSYTLNRRWTFSSRGPVIAQLGRFLLVQGTAYIFNLAAVLVLARHVGVNRYVAQAIGVVPYTTVGYLGSRFFAFRGAAARNVSAQL